ncbi:MAG: hypothetical protein ACO2PN_23190 [Pyrobaculum sp.]
MYSRGGVYWIGRRGRRPRRLEDGCLVDVRWRGQAVAQDAGRPLRRGAQPRLPPPTG